MQGYEQATYGERLADDFDTIDWNLADLESVVSRLQQLAGAGPALELGVGTGRVALALARTGVPVDGIEVSPRMVERLREKVGDAPLTVIAGDFGDLRVRRRYTLVYCVWNTLFMLPSRERQEACFRGVAQALLPGGAFLLEAFVPDPSRYLRDQSIRIRDMTADSVSLDLSIHDPATQIVRTQHVFLRASGTRMYPAVMRYSWPHELDEMAQAAGLRLDERSADWRGEPFDDSSAFHVSVYRRA